MKRGRLETIIRIMEVLNEDNPAIRTQIMQKANLNYRALLWYLELLEASGMIHSVRERHGRISTKYFITNKGHEFLENIEQALGRLGAAL